MNAKERYELRKQQKTPAQKKKEYTKKTEQYDAVPELENQNKCHLNKETNSPYCNIHGAMLCFKHNVWKCLDCGFSCHFERRRRR